MPSHVGDRVNGLLLVTQRCYGTDEELHVSFFDREYEPAALDGVLAELGHTRKIKGESVFVPLTLAGQEDEVGQRVEKKELHSTLEWVRSLFREHIGMKINVAA